MPGKQETLNIWHGNITRGAGNGACFYLDSLFGLQHRNKRGFVDLSNRNWRVIWAWKLLKELRWEE